MAPSVEAPPLLKTAEINRSIIPSDAQVARVKTVTDGDTITLEDGRKVRYIGIDTPEREDPYYNEAKQLNASLVQGKTVYLEFDVERKDRYDRPLAYIYVRTDDGRELFVNAELIRAGLARLYTFPPNVRHVDTLRQCQKEAIAGQRGTWKNYVFNSEPYFVSTKNGRAFHRPNCKDIANSQNLTKYQDAREALETGKSPCRSCKP